MAAELGCEWYVVVDLDKLNNNIMDDNHLNKKKNKKKKNNNKNAEDFIISPLLSAPLGEPASFSVSMGTDFYILGGKENEVVEEESDGYTYNIEGHSRALKFDAKLLPCLMKELNL